MRAYKDKEELKAVVNKKFYKYKKIDDITEALKKKK